MKKITLILVVLAVFAGMAQGQTFVPISTAKSNLWVGGTNTFFPNTNVARSIKGRVTTPFLSKSGDTIIYIQDTTTGIRVRGYGNNFELETNSAVFQPGVEVSVLYSLIEQDRGAQAIAVEYYDGEPYEDYNDFYISNPTPVPVAPQETTIENFFNNGEDYEGRLIKITNLTCGAVTWPYGEDFGFYATNGADVIQIRLLAGTDVPGQLAPTNEFDLIGIASQFTTDPIPSNGYQIIAFSYSNFIQNVGLEQPALVVTPSAASVKVGRQLDVTVLAQDRNSDDVLTITTNQTIEGSTFTSIETRTKLFSWTPELTDAGTIHTAVFAVTDGVYTNMAELVVTVADLYPSGYAWINEFHYDDDGIDDDEGVELAGAAGISLDEYDILLYNGANGLVYVTNNCSGTIDDEGAGYGAVWFPTPNNQNGPDGIALVHDVYGLLDFISYEGAFTASNGPATGIASADVGVAEDGEPEGMSLQLSGVGTNYESFVWVGPITATPGDLNATQTVGGAVNAAVSFSGLAISPTVPSTNAFDIVCTITPNASAESLSATAYYTLNGGVTSSITMSGIGNDYTTDGTVDGQPDGTIVSYWVGVTFSGPGSTSNSPSFSGTNTIEISEVDGWETFANYPETGTTYTDGTFTGQDGSTWSYTQCNAAPEGVIDEESPVLGRARTPLAQVESGSIAGGCGTLSFELKQVFSAPYDLDLYVNDGFVANFSGGTQGVVDFSGDITVNVTGDFVLKFVQADSAAGQVSIDNIVWTVPDPNQPVITITNPAAASLSVPNATATYTIQGSANANVIGQIKWTNSLTGATGSVAAATSWDIGSIALDEGVNVITVSGTNSESVAVSDSVTITRSEPGLASDIIISQYVETDTGSVPKGIEVWNVSGSDITFEATNQLDIKIGVNGAALAVVTSVTAGTLSAGDVWVIGTSDMTPDAEYTFTFNGDDAISIELAGVLQDVFGEPGVDPGSAWSGNGVSTANQNIQLKDGITEGDSDGWSDPSTRFELVGTGTDLTGFGVAPGVAGMSVTITNPAAASLTVSNDVATYTVQGTASSNAVGQLSWTNALTGASGTIAAATVWSIADIALNVGDNLITVSGTNAEEVAASDSVTITRELAPPVIQAASGVASEQFNANWLASDGATGYYLDVATNEAFAGGGGGGNLMSNAGFETGDSTDWDKFEAGYSVVTASPQEGTYAVECVATATRDLMQAVDITGDGVTEYEISYYYKVSAGDDSDVRIWATWAAGGQDSGDSLQPASYNATEADWTKIAYTVVPSSGANTLNYEIRVYNGATVYLDNFFVGVAGGGGGGGSDFVPGYQNRDVGNVTTYAVTGLTEGVTYHYRVRAYNDTVTTINSGVTNVTTGASTTPEITGFSVPAGATATVTLTTTINGETYALEYTTDPTASPVVWTEADSDVGDGGELILTDASPSDVMRIYRVVLQ